MSPRTVAPPPTDNRLWRRVLAAVHPDRDGDHETFIWLQGVREHVEQCHALAAPLHRDTYQQRETGERIPYDEQLGYVDEHVVLTMRAQSIGARSEEPYASVLILLLDCPSQEHGRVALRQCRGVTYKQLAYIAHLGGMAKSQRTRWYDLARSIPLSEQHAHHLIGKLKMEKAA